METKTREKSKTRPRYNTVQNVGWMAANAWRSYRPVLLTTTAAALLDVGLNLLQLFIAPQVLQRVEQAAPLGALARTIAAFTALLFAVTALRAYVGTNWQTGRMAVNMSIFQQYLYKSATTSFPHTLDQEVIRLRTEGNPCAGNYTRPSEYIWVTLASLLKNVVGFGVYLALLSHMEPLMLVVVVATSAAGFLTTRRAGDWSFRHRAEKADCQNKARYIREKSESITLAKDVRLFGLQEWLTGLYDSALRLYEDFLDKAGRMQLLGDAVDLLLGVARNGIAYFYLISLALEGGMPASEFLLYFTAVSGFSAWVTGILNDAAKLHQHSLGLCPIREYLELEEPFRFAGGAPIPASDGYELRLDHVSFRYPGAEKDTIHDLCLTIRPGEKLAIVGLNGAGKTTLVKLLSGLFDPTAGRVLLNGQDIREFDRQDYYGLFSALFQDFSIIGGSVAENVAQRSEGIDLPRVRACLAQAGLTEKMDSLPKELDTPVGKELYEDGVLFSGGETQRLMLARALYKNGPILLLDEPTAALDPLAENDIYQKYNEMAGGKTALFISHRLASTRFCDRVLFVADGGIAEEGTHKELLARGGQYAALFEVQSRYYQEGRDF